MILYTSDTRWFCWELVVGRGLDSDYCSIFIPFFNWFDMVTVYNCLRAEIQISTISKHKSSWKRNLIPTGTLVLNYLALYNEMGSILLMWICPDYSLYFFTILGLDPSQRVSPMECISFEYEAGSWTSLGGIPSNQDFHGDGWVCVIEGNLPGIYKQAKF